ncbi:MAG: hypothetical protein D6693_05385 [Planctomycetota bacterium]|nr:MAG: hypothetical protein D6693_05385 [Planctomycetota bacterium]
MTAQTPVDCEHASPYFDLTFPGGTVQDLVREIREVYPCANVALMEEAREYPVPPMELRQVTVGAALALVEGRRELEDHRWQYLGVDSHEIEGRVDRVYRVYSESSVEAGPALMTPSVWGLAPILEQGLSEEALLGAVDAALKTFPSEATVRFHEPTGLLIVRGTKAQLDLVERVLGELRAAAKEKADSSQAVTIQLADQRARVAQAESRVALEMKRVQIERAKLDSLEDADRDNPWIAGKHEIAVAEAEAALRSAQAAYEREATVLRMLTEGKGGKGDDRR